MATNPTVQLFGQLAATRVVSTLAIKLLIQNTTDQDRARQSIADGLRRSIDGFGINGENAEAVREVMRTTIEDTIANL